MAEEETIQAVPEPKKRGPGGPKKVKEEETVELTSEEAATIPKEVNPGDLSIAVRAAAKLVVEHWLKGNLQPTGHQRNLALSHLRHLKDLVLK